MGAEGCPIETLFSKCQLPALKLRYGGSMRMRHSKIQQIHLRGGGEEQSEEDNIVPKETTGWLPRLEQRTSTHYSEAEEENWSLVDLLSRSTSASSQRPTPLLTRHRLILEPPEEEPTKSTLPIGIWRRPACMTNFSCLDGLNEDTDADTEDNCDSSDYFCGISSASSISWAEDAVEAEQTDKLAKLWNEVEGVCGGGPKPEKMSNAVYEECLLWRRAFPTESFSTCHRFESMDDFLIGENDEDSTPTPTNDNPIFSTNSMFQNFSRTTSLNSSLNSAWDLERDCSTPTPQTTSDFVTAWLSECHLQDPDDIDDEKPNVPNVTRSYSGETQYTEDNYCSKSTTMFRSSTTPEISSGLKTHEPLIKSDSTELNFLPSIHLSKFEGNGTNKQNLRRFSTTLGEHHEVFEGKKENTIFRVTDQHQELYPVKINEAIPNVQQPNRLVSVPKEDRFVGRNSSKPFLLWLFDRVSPT